MLKRSFLAFAITSALATPSLAADRLALSAADLTAEAKVYDLVENSAFLRPSDASSAHAPFVGTITLTEGKMFSNPTKFKKDEVLGKNPQIFPGVALTFITVGDDLVPATQDVIRNGSTPQGHSFWDIIVQPGKVWSESADEGWSRASFPFSLMHSIEGETHNGVATFLYKDGQISNLRFQVLTQTSPFYIEDYFTASGSVKASLDGRTPVDASAIEATFKSAAADAETIRPWSELESKFGDKLAGFDGKIRPEEIVLDGLAINGAFYLKSCPTPAGPLPYCERQRFGVWSVTKSAGNAVAMLRIAEKYGKEIFTTKITDYITEAKGLPGWENVTFGDALNMATGMGYGSDKPDAGTGEPFTDGYYAWYEAPTTDAKIAALLKFAKPYKWGPGKVARYRDEDMFLVGVAMTRFLKAKEGPKANVWDFVKEEVYKPIGIQYAPINKTIEADPKDDQALMAYGFYPTIGDLIKIARLYQNDGKVDGKQVLNAEMLADLKPSSASVGLPTYNPEKPHYHKAFWRPELKDCKLHYSVMDGWGENYVMLLPQDITIFRLAKNWDGDPNAGNLENMTDVAAKLKPLCR